MPPSKSLLQRPSSLGALSRAAHVRRQSESPKQAWDGDHALYALPYGLVIVDHSYDIHYINTEARGLLGIHTTALDQDLIHLVQRFDPLQIRRLIDAAIQSREASREVLSSSDVAGEGLQSIELICVPIDDREDADGNVAVTVLNVTEREQMRRRMIAAEESAARLMKANAEVLAANHQLTHSLNRLRDENEHMQVASAEIQAATEEVETLNEELQASNEELETLNEELQATVEELNTTNDDLEARSLELQTMAIHGEASRQQLSGILDAVDDGILVVDRNGAIVLQSRMLSAMLGAKPDSITFLTDDGSPMEGEATPVARAARGESFVMTFRVSSSEATLERYEAIGRAVALPGNPPLGVVTIRACPEP